MSKPIVAFAIALAACAAEAEDVQRLQRIPLAVGSDFQLEPIRAIIPDQKSANDGWENVGSPIKLIGFEPERAPAQNPQRQQEVPSRPWWAFWRGSRESCIADATKLPTDAGVRIAYRECMIRFP